MLKGEAMVGIELKENVQKLNYYPLKQCDESHDQEEYVVGCQAFE